MVLLTKLLKLPFIPDNANMFFQKGYAGKPNFESQYLALRKTENRLYPDEVVARLPQIADPALEREWRLREKSLERLLLYLRKRPNARTFLEIGCGNGWLAHHLSTLPNSEVLALDINEAELRQAASVFKDRTNLFFIYADIFQLNENLTFDCIVLASAIQYFPDLDQLVTKLRTLLTIDGDIHILDSPIYDRHHVAHARERSATYFHSRDSGMKDFYFHHTWDAVNKLRPTVLHHPDRLHNRLKRLFTLESPFPWVRLGK